MGSRYLFYKGTGNQDVIALFNLNTCLVLILQTKGFFNVTSLALMSFFDLANGLVPDYMHGALLGITKTLMYNWFSPTKAKKQCFIGNKVCTKTLYRES